MLSIIEQIKQGQLWDFPGGIHPPENKTLSSRTPIIQAGIPDELVLPLKQHIGTKGDILVAVGDQVLKGQPLTQSDMSMCVPIHAPTSGTVTAIEARTTAHPSGLTDLCIVIKSDGQDTWAPQTKIADYTAMEPGDLIDTIRLSGIAGLGGAGFPTGRKLQGSLGLTDIMIINAAECEPYITADDRLMQDYAQEVIEGIRILRHIVSPKLTLIGIEDNKPEAIKALEQCVTPEDNILIRVIPTKYPSGSSKQLVKLLTGREVPSGGRSSAVGVVVQNVGTAFAVKRAVVDGEPLIERVVTLTGEAFKDRGNVFARLGTPVAYLLDKYGYQPDKKYPRVIIGGSLMGFTLPHANVPITKITNCILTPKRRELPLHNHEMACIRCSACADACPSSLLPQQLQWYAKDQDYAKCEEYNLFDCIECGACAYVCPSEIPLVNYYRQAKAEIYARRQDEANAERAKQRFEAKQARFEREKAARENRFKKAADDRRKEMAATGGDDAVAAAIARVKAKQAAAATGQDADKKPAVAAAIARAKAKQAEAAKAGTTDTAQPDNSEMAKLREERKREARERKAAKLAAEQNTSADATAEAAPSGDAKKDAVAAAIARAKARKAAQAGNADTTEDTVPTAEPANNDADPKKAAVAAAVARAKARKAAQAGNADATEDTAPAAEPTTNDADPKKAAVAAAVARAKARKAAQAGNTDTTENAAPAAEPANNDADPKKAAVAAAVARAKARKAAQEAAKAQESTQTEAPTNEPVVDSNTGDKASDANALNADASEPVDPKKAAVAAAVARAKARKAVQEAAKAQESDKAETPANEPVVDSTAGDKASDANALNADASEPVDPKKAAVAAAVARAKARKAAQEAAKAEAAQPVTDNDVSDVVPETVPDSVPEAVVETATPEAIDPKKAAVAAAVARAKARKAAQEAAKLAAQAKNEEN